MNHPPKQLALLISLIGGGLSPYAQARIHEHRMDLAQTMPDIACTELDAMSLPACDTPAPRDLAWQPQRSALDLSTTAGVLVLYGARGDDWAPGETGEASDAPASASAPIPEAARVAAPHAPATTAPSAAADTPRATARPPRHIRVLAKAAVAKIARFARADAQAIERLAPIAQLERSEATDTRGRASPPGANPPPVASAGSIEVERLLANLASVLNGERAAPPAAVENHADKVLRHLDAILSDRRDAVGAIQPEPPVPAAVSHGDAVLKALGEFAAPATTATAAPSPAVEDGPARRLRKLAARAAKAQADARAQTAANGVDLLLPIEPPASAPRTSPFGDTTVAISENSLDRVRGGYAGEGLNISFGIERAVYINGSLATTTSLNVTDLGQITAGRGTAVLDTGTIALIQSGAGNSVAGGSISSSAMGTIVQNTLDGQKIQNVTVVNATANSLGVFRTMNLQSSLRGAVIDSLRR